MRRTLPLLVLLALSACSGSPHKLASCHGPVVALNIEHWQPTASDLAAFDLICPEDK